MYDTGFRGQRHECPQPDRGPASRNKETVMSRVAHRLAGVVSGALVVAAIALPATNASANAATGQSARATTDITICVDPLNPVWGDGCQP
jgi:hypothetical protein